MYKDDQYISTDGLFWPEILRKDVPKSHIALQPVYEAFTNSIEAIRDRQKVDSKVKGEIHIKIDSAETTIPDTFSFSSLTITDNGIGFNDDQFQRFNTFRDNRKNYKNLGSGRIQYVHFFNSTLVKSIFEQKGELYEREFIMSKSSGFLKHNSLVKHKYCKKSTLEKIETKIIFNSLIEKSGVYDELSDDSLKKRILERYIHYLCHNQKTLPKINIEFYVQGKLKSQSSITNYDIPNIDKKKDVKVYYSRNQDNNIEKTKKYESFRIEAFKINKKILKENKLHLVSKGEVIDESEITLQSLASGDTIHGNKYLFLVSSNYIDSKDTNLRGVLNIPTRDFFTKDLHAQREDIIVEDIQEKLNNSISTMYPEIEEVKQKHEDGFVKLKEMFLLDDDTAKNIKFSINDSEAKILEKFYEAEARKSAYLDASIKESVDKVEKLDTTKSDYQDELKKAVDELVKTIPLQNKLALTHYVARRKLVLDLFQKILNNETAKVNNGGKIDEDVLHNLIFQQSSKDPMTSDLWLVNDEYIYFKGVSEGILGQIEFDGTKILKEILTDEELEYRTKQGGDARLKRTDILLFPAESKCIIIELKAPGINISEHLNQINRYASLINNLSIDNLKFNTFYGYLIGENIDVDDIIDNDSDFKNAPNLGYIFRPYKRIVGKFGRGDGSLYTEIIKYSTLLERAKQRNKIFIDKLK